jgi:hypothetical protein
LKAIIMSKPAYPATANMSGTIAHEVIHGGAATIAGGCSWVAGGTGAFALALDGTGSATYPTDSHVSKNGGSSQSIVAVFRHAATPWSTVAAEYFASKDGEYFLCQTADGFERVWNYNANAGQPDSLVHRSASPSLGAPHTMIGVISANAATALYLDGAAIGGQIILAATKAPTTANSLVIGQGFTGQIESIQLFQRPLTTADVAAIGVDPYAWATHTAPASAPSVRPRFCPPRPKIAAKLFRNR